MLQHSYFLWLWLAVWLPRVNFLSVQTAKDALILQQCLALQCPICLSCIDPHVHTGVCTATHATPIPGKGGSAKGHASQRHAQPELRARYPCVDVKSHRLTQLFNFTCLGVSVEMYTVTVLAKPLVLGLKQKNMP